MGRFADIRFDEEARHGYGNLRHAEHTESELLFEKGKAFDFRSSRPGSERGEGAAILRDSKGMSSRSARMRVEQFEKRGRKSRKSIQYAKRAMVNRLASVAATSSAAAFSDREDEDHNQGLSAPQGMPARASSSASVSRFGRNSNHPERSQLLSRKQIRRLNKAKAKELTKAARAKRQASKIALDSGKASQSATSAGSSAASAKGKDKLFEKATNTIIRTGGTAIGTAGALMFGLVIFFMLIGAVIGVVASDGMMKKANFSGMTEDEAAVAVYLTAKGLDPLHVAAIMGNIEAESGFDPGLIEAGSGEGFGICQWSFERKHQLIRYAGTKGKPATDMQVQLDFLWAELTGEGDAAGFANVQYDHTGFLELSNLKQAVMYFGQKFERPSEAYAHWDRRIASAERYFAILSATSSLPDNEIIMFAASKLGCPYVWGAAGENAFDCSGLVSWSYNKAGITGISRTTYTQIKQCIEIPRELAKPGDLIFCNYSSPGVPEHVALYIGDGKVIHAPQPGDVVKISPVNSWPDAMYYRYVE